MELHVRLLLAVPGDVFEQVKSSVPCPANWLAPALIFIALSWVGTWLIFSQPALQHQVTEIAEKSIQQGLEKSHLSGDEAERARQKGAEYASMFSKVRAFAAPIFSGITLFLMGLQGLR